MIFASLLPIAICHSDYSVAQSDLRIPPIREVMQSANHEQPENLDKIKGNVAVDFYISAVTQRIEKIMFAWPKSELDNRVYGDINVTIIINIDGTVLNIYTSETRSEHGTKLAEVATKMVKRAEPYPPPPKAILGGRNSVQLSRSFNFIKDGRSGTIGP